MFKYNVTKDDFMEMSIFVMKQKSAKLSSKIKLVLFTVVQMAAVVYLIFLDNDASLTLRILLGATSLIWAFQTVYSYGFYKSRAKLMLANQRDNDRTGEFWKEHKLSLRDEKISLSYGEAEASLECAQISGTQETENLTLLMSGTGIFEIVPKTVSETPEFTAFLDEIRSVSAAKLKAAQDKQRASAIDNAAFLEYLNFSEEELLAQLIRMKRCSFRYAAGWSKITFLVFTVPIVILILSIVFVSPLYALLAIVFFLFMNAGTLMIFTPLYKNVVKKSLQPAGEGGYLLTVANGGVHLFTREYHYKYMISDLRSIRTDKSADYYYFANQEMLFVPDSCRDAFKKAVTKSHSLSSLSHMGNASVDSKDKKK